MALPPRKHATQSIYSTRLLKDTVVKVGYISVHQNSVNILHINIMENVALDLGPGLVTNVWLLSELCLSLDAGAVWTWRLAALPKVAVKTSRLVCVTVSSFVRMTFMVKEVTAS